MRCEGFVAIRDEVGIVPFLSIFSTCGLSLACRARLERYYGAKASWVLDAWIETWLSAELASWSLDDLLERTFCTVLAIHRDQDEFGTFAHLERIASCAAGLTEVVRLTGCGHVPHREAPVRVIERVATFIAAQVEQHENRQEARAALGPARDGAVALVWQARQEGGLIGERPVDSTICSCGNAFGFVSARLGFNNACAAVPLVKKAEQ